MKKAFKGSQHTPDAIWQKIVVFKKIFVFLRIALKDLLQTDTKDIKNLGIGQVGL